MQKVVEELAAKSLKQVTIRPCGGERLKNSLS